MVSCLQTSNIFRNPNLRRKLLNLRKGRNSTKYLEPTAAQKCHYDRFAEVNKSGLIETDSNIRYDDILVINAQT